MSAMALLLIIAALVRTQKAHSRQRRRLHLSKTHIGLSATAALALAASGPALAIDYQPYDWIPLPAGRDVFMGYYVYAEHNEFTNFLSGTAKGPTSLDVNIGAARYLHYGLLGDHPYVLDFILPFGALTNGKIGGTRLDDASGVGDPIASIGYWLVNDPAHKRYLSAVTFVTFPVGTYDSKKTLNLGGNRWQVDMQADYTQGLSDRTTIDVSGDWIRYGDNSNSGSDHQTLSQHSTYSAYLWLTYDISPELRKLEPNAGQTTFSVGYAGTFGGMQKLDGVSTGLKTDEQQIRASYSQFVTPTLEGTVSLSHDLYAGGQFKENFGVLFRIAKVF
jgi:hypothetical protein